MATAVGSGHLYETYTPSGMNHPQIQQLENRVHELLLKLKSETSGWWSNGDIRAIEELKDQLDFAVYERNRIYHQIAELEARLNRSNALLAKSDAAHQRSEIARKKIEAVYRAREKGAAIGGGMGLAGSLFWGLTAAWTGACVLISAVAGGYVNGRMEENRK